MTMDLPFSNNPDPSSDHGPGYGDSLAEAQAYVQAHLDKGVRCPACTRWGKRYRRALCGSMIKQLASLLRLTVETGKEWVHYSAFQCYQPALYCKLAYWGFIEQKPKMDAIKKQDKRASGYWRILPKGKQFLMRQCTVNRYAVDFDGRCLRLEGKLVTVDECLTKKFSWAELMAGIPTDI